MGPTPRLIRPRVVFDTNVLVSALLFREGLLGWLVDAWKRCEAVVVSAVIEAPDCRDPEDRMFLKLAAAANADALVTGDGDLLALGTAFATPILTPAAMKAQLD